MRSVAIAKTYGVLSITRNRTSYEYEIEYYPESLAYPSFNEQNWIVDNVDQVIYIITELPNAIYINSRDLLLPREQELYKEMRDCIFYYWKCDLHCFVCNEDA